jgi:hypothetical protein
MKKYPLIGSSICAVVLLVLASLTNVVGYQTVQTSNQKIITTEINEKDLLFQTILDMANNKEIQKVILGSEIIGKRFFDPCMRFSFFTIQVLTEKFLKCMYTMGVMLSKTINKSKMHSLLGRHPVSNQWVQKQISSVIEKDFKLKGEMKQLSSLSCDCENKNTTKWGFPVLCEILFFVDFFLYVIYTEFGILHSLMLIVDSLFFDKLNCLPFPYNV